ncbi:growth inhibition and differentiation-related protein 88 [Carex littledalei]|uniref:Growth inhibition and differentiation-related protein 88 n=1 Tax=Carex littledalei TaxID=544730 RepID=A0A833VYC8_9POAL|nr:growth inhibition and differentiation-related protein 88 [Carex littledalei]
MEESNQKQGQDQGSKTLTLEEKVENWSEHVENLRDSGDTDGAISFLELFISRLDGGSSTSTGVLQLAAAMSDLADLYSLRGYTIKSDELRSRALSIRSRINKESSTPIASANLRVAQPTTISVKEKDTEGSILSTTSDNDVEDGEDDWEALADKAESDLNILSLKPKAETSLAESGKLEHKEKDNSFPPSDNKPKRKGRGSFLYNNSMLYSEIQEEFKEANDPRLDSSSNTERENEANFGTRHVLVLYDLPTKTRTTELEKIFEVFDGASVAIRWFNDTSALAVFRNPSLADSAKSCIPSRYKFRCLHDDDELLPQLKPGDLKPPFPRPKTSARTAQRMIAQSMGLRIISPGSGVREHKQQEQERKDRIVTRQALREDAWGTD